MSDELRTVFIWDTQSPEKGAEKIEQSYERADKARKEANQNAERDSSDSGNLRQHARDLRQRARAYQDIETMEKASHQRRAKIRDEAYAAADRAEKRRVDTLTRSIRTEANHTTAAMRSGGGHGGHGGGLLGGGSARMIGDGLDMLTGQRGWYMRTSMANHLLPRLGSLALPAAALAALAVEGGRGAARVFATDATAASARNGFASAIGATDFHSAGQGTASLTEQIGKLQEQRKVQEELQAQLREDGDPQHTSWANRVGFKYWDTIRYAAHGMLGRTNAQKIAEADAQQRGLTGQESILRGERSEAYAHMTSVARERFSGSEFEARRMESAFAEKGEIAEAKRGHASAADLDQIARKFAVANQQIGLEEQGEQRGVSMQNRETYIRGRGEDVAQRTAYARFQTEDEAAGAAQGTEAKAKAEAARTAAWQQYVEAERTTRLKKTEQGIEKETAEFRGNAEERSRHAAEAALEIEEARLAIAKESGAEATREQAIRVATAKRGLAEENQRYLEGSISRAAAIRTSGASLNTAAFRATQGLYSQNENTRFAAGQTVERREAAEGVFNAQTALTAVNLKAQGEKRNLKGISEETAKDQVLAQQQLIRAKLEQLEVEKKLTFEATQRRRQLTAELFAAQNETAAMRIDNTGRSDRAGVFRSRASTEARALEFERHGFHGLAEEAQKQQHQREIGLYDAKYLRPDGRRRLRFQVNRDERLARLVEQRHGRAHDRLQRDGGLIDVHRDSRGNMTSGTDPLTREHVSREQLYARRHHAEEQAKKESKQDSLTLEDFWKKLDARLPKLR